MSDFSIHREVQHLTERLYKLERDTRTILDVKDARIADLEAVIWQLSRDPEMADVYVLAQINIENKARIAELEAFIAAHDHEAFVAAYDHYRMRGGTLARNQLGATRKALESDE